MKYNTMPFNRGISMPVQKLTEYTGKKCQFSVPAGTAAARFVLIVMTCLLTAGGCSALYFLLGPAVNEFSYIVFFVFFALTLCWISFSASSAVIGFCAVHKRRSWKEDTVSGSRTALVMPLYNEDVTRSLAAMEAMARDLCRTGFASCFDIVILSDSTKQTVLEKEQEMYVRLRKRLSGTMQVWYRNRTKNTARKAGNIADFIENWGSLYDYMVVLDADSIMSARTIVTMIQRMQGDRNIGILQTVPILCGDMNFFARLQQFASRVYGRVNGAGIAAWAGNEGNYWGHNAAVRIKAFAASCGLPQLSGFCSFGGYILSHDFVEAALMRRAGWKVCIASDLYDSWEESPPSLLDQTIRDRRWTQGNFQHLRVIGAKGLSFWNRLHFAVGIMGYLSSVLWLLLIVSGTVIMVTKRGNLPVSVFTDTKMFYLFVYTLIVLFIPKMLGWLSTMLQGNVCRSCGGRATVTFGVIVEIIFSSLFSPVTMLFNTKNIVEIFSGRDAGWKSQRRSLDRLSVREAWRAHRLQCIGGTVFLSAFIIKYPESVLWYIPTLAGLIASVPLSVMSSSRKAGIFFSLFHLLVIPEETSVPEIIRSRDRIADELKSFPAADNFSEFRRVKQVHVYL